jgi:hypothetical protein
MDVDVLTIGKLTPEEWEKCIQEGHCLQCCQKGHMAQDCPNFSHNPRLVPQSKKIAKVDTDLSNLIDIEDDDKTTVWHVRFSVPSKKDF